MNTVNTNWNLGNYNVGLVAEVSDSVRDVLANLGLRFLGQRNTEVDKILGAFEKGADGKPKRKAGWKRNEVGYAKTLADALTKSFESLAIPDSAVKVSAVCEIVEYVREEKDGILKDAQKVAEARESLPEAEYALWLKGLPYDGPTHTEDGEAFHPGLLGAISAKIRKLRAEAVAGV